MSDAIQYGPYHPDEPLAKYTITTARPMLRLGKEDPKYWVNLTTHEVRKSGSEFDTEKTYEQITIELSAAEAIGLHEALGAIIRREEEKDAPK